MLTRRAFVVAVVAGFVAVGDAMTTAQELAQAVFAGARMALRRTVVQALEPITGSWVNNNLFGDQRFEPLPVTAGSVISVLPKNTRLYGPPAVHSLQLSRSDDVPTENADVYARITTGCGGIENSFDCDWLHGLQLALVCNSISVQAVTYAPFAGQPYDAAAARVALKAAVAKGSTCPSRCPATYTEPSVLLKTPVDAPDNVVVYTFPDFAREFTVHLASNSNPATPTNVFVDFFNAGGTSLATYDAQVCAGGRSIPIPGGANTVAVNNQGGVNLRTTAQFFLGL